jgi:hypothetical protein
VSQPLTEGLTTPLPLEYDVLVANSRVKLLPKLLAVMRRPLLLGYPDDAFVVADDGAGAGGQPRCLDERPQLHLVARGVRLFPGRSADGDSGPAAITGPSMVTAVGENLGPLHAWMLPQPARSRKLGVVEVVVRTGSDRLVPIRSPWSAVSCEKTRAEFCCL